MNELEIVHNLNHFDTIPQKAKLAFNSVEINAQTTFSKAGGFKFIVSPDNNNPIDFGSSSKRNRAERCRMYEV